MVFKEGNIFIIQLLKLLYEERNLDFSNYAMPFIERRIKKRMEATQQDSFKNYLYFTQAYHEELDLLIDLLTVNYSLFFRNTLVFAYLSKFTIPQIVENALKENKASIRIWSAGCAAGEEPYSLAILLKEYLEKEKINLKISIFATDIDKKVLTKATKGIYTTAQLENVKLGYLEKYFTKDNHHYLLNESIKKLVEFHYFDLILALEKYPKESIYGSFDMVFCRNVLIYLNNEQQIVMLKKLHKALDNNGLLVLGESENIDKSLQSIFKLDNNFIKIFKKNNTFNTSIK